VALVSQVETTGRAAADCDGTVDNEAFSTLTVDCDGAGVEAFCTLEDDCNRAGANKALGMFTGDCDGTHVETFGTPNT
jgi:hypothetical protein